MLNKLKARKNQLQGKGGFTLVELIVVLVILAILAALLIPALTGYIDKAKEKNAVAECRQVVMAAQTLYDEAYGKDSTAAITFSSTAAIKFEEVAKLAEVDKDKITKIEADGTTHKINKVQYTGSNGFKIQYNGTGYERVENFT
mgnify:CR=1 FL=1